MAGVITSSFALVLAIVALTVTFVGAAGQVKPPVNLVAGDSVTINCAGGKLSNVSSSNTAFTIKCLGAPAIAQLTNISAGAALKGKVNIEAKVTEGSSPIANVLFELFQNGQKIHSWVEPAAPYFYYGDNNAQPNGWDTTNRADGQYSLSVTVTGSDNLSSNLKVNFSIANVVVVPTATPTSAPPTATPTTPPGGVQDSMSMGLWNPNPKFDVCKNADGSINADATARIKQFHDSFSVIAPDGKRYPTWHPPVAKDPATGAMCSFGHEHGKDPSTFPNWQEIKQYFAYNGDVARSGIPFGYVNEQMDAWVTATGSNIPMRHEDHVGHKVEWGTNISVDIVKGSNGAKTPSGVTCNYFSKVHQGTTSHDAFENNLHELFYMVKCSDGQDLKLARMMEFGKAGQFLRLCDPEGDRTTVINTGFSYSNAAYPGTAQDGVRNITDRSCVINNFLVPGNKWTMNMYEAWPGSMSITGAQGQPLVRTLDLLFDVENSMRYYYPGKTHPELADASKYSDAGFTMDLCYEVLANGNKSHGGACDAATNSGSIKGITWDDPRSAYKGTSRGMYVKPGDVQNASGPAIWYTDPFGQNAKTTPFPGSVKQYIVQRNIDYGQKFGGFVDPTKMNSDFDAPTVHAPN